MKIAHTRAMVNAVLNGELNNVEYETDPVFGVEIPKTCPNVPQEVLNPRNTWADKTAYDNQARKLAAMFIENFKQFEDQVSEEVRRTAPKA
jgi:phosphoenolpyruvate carboxykinase (ATP)